MQTGKQFMQATAQLTTERGKGHSAGKASKACQKEEYAEYIRPRVTSVTQEIVPAGVAGSLQARVPKQAGGGEMAAAERESR